jgi:hypothetical protein
LTRELFFYFFAKSGNKPILVSLFLDLSPALEGLAAIKAPAVQVSYPTTLHNNPHNRYEARLKNKKLLQRFSSPYLANKYKG